jgi:hypothetical protein
MNPFIAMGVFAVFILLYHTLYGVIGWLVSDRVEYPWSWWVIFSTHYYYQHWLDKHFDKLAEIDKTEEWDVPYGF